MNKENEIIQFFVINKEVEMSKAKVAVSVAHVATKITYYHHHENIFKKWFLGDQKKIILRGKEKDLEKLIDEYNFLYIRDLGLTEVPNNTLTCVGLPPMYRKEGEKYVKGLQLYNK